MINEHDILRFLSDDADNALISNIESWKNKDEVNEKELALYQRIWEESSNLDSIKAFDLDEEWSSLESLLDAGNKSVVEDVIAPKVAKVIPLSLKRRFSVAASIILLAGVTSIFFINNQVTSTETSYTYNPDVKTFGYSDKIGDSDEITLPDGSKVKLEKGSTIYFEKSFEGKDTRTVSINGNAVIEAANNPDQPFVVNSAPAGIQVLGTIFKVISDGQKAEVENVEGLVNVFILKDPSLEQKLNPGERAVVTDEIEFFGLEKPAPPPPPAGEDVMIYDLLDFLSAEYPVVFQPQPYAKIQNDKIFLELDKSLDYTINQLVERTDSKISHANGIYFIYEMKK